LYRTLREERGMAYYISAEYHAYQDAGALVVEGAPTPATLVPVLAGVLLEIIGMASEVINMDTHFRCVQSLISQHYVSGDSPYVRMSRLALQEMYFQETVPSDAIATGLRSQTPNKIKQTAIKVLESGLPVISLTGPVSEELLQAVGSMLTDFGDAPPELVYGQGNTTLSEEKDEKLKVTA